MNNNNMDQKGAKDIYLNCRLLHFKLVLLLLPLPTPDSSSTIILPLLSE